MSPSLGPASDVDGRLNGHMYMYEALRTVLGTLEVLAMLALAVGYWGINCANLYEASAGRQPVVVTPIKWQLLG